MITIHLNKTKILSSDIHNNYVQIIGYENHPFVIYSLLTNYQLVLCNMPRGVYLVQGVGGTWSQGCTWSQGVYLVRYSPPVDRMTHTYENITLPQTSFAGGNESNKFWLGFTTVLSYEITSRFTGLKGIQIFILPHYKTKKRRQCGSHRKNANPYSL